MKAAQISSFDEKDSLKINDNVIKPQAKADEVLVEVYAAAINPFDLKLSVGNYPNIKLNFPATLGGDVAGVVAEVGGEVQGFSVGQPVYGEANAAGSIGSFAEFTLVKANQLSLKPNSIDFINAASLPLVTTSAYQALVEHMNFQKDQKILIHGGAGGIGGVAIQLAKHIGAYVATTAAADDTDYVKSLGADEVIDYQKQDFMEVIKDYDAVFDTVNGDTTAKSYQVLKKGGHLVSMLAQPDPNLVDKYGINFTSQQTKPTSDKLTKITELVDSGVIKPRVAKVFSLDQAAEAMEYLKSAKPKGKVVIKVRDLRM